MKNLYNSYVKNSSLFYVLICAGLIGIFPISMAQDSPWTQKADMPTGRLGIATAVVDGKIYAIGGYTRANGAGLTTNEVYDPVTDSWEKKAFMPTGRHWLTASAVNGKIYAIGGYTSYGQPGLPTIEEYDPATDTWETKTDMPTPRLGPASCVVDGIIYVIGGASTVSQQLKTVEAYDPETDTWTKKADLPFARMMLNVNAVNGKIYAIGGRYGSLQMYMLIEEYDPATDTWIKKFDMPIKKGGYATTVMNAKIYIIGGVNIESGVWNIYPLVEEYDPIANTWARGTDMPKQRWALGANTVDGKIYAIGGAATDISNGHPGVKTVYQYDPSKDLATLVKTFNISKCFVEAGNDSICFTTKIDDPAGVTLFAMIESPDQTCIDSIQLFDDGNHNDENAGDSIYSNIWHASSAEENYYVDLKVKQENVETVIHRMDNMALFTTIGPVVYKNYAFGSPPIPGERIDLEITLANEGSITTASDIKFKIFSLDSLVTVTYNIIYPFVDISPGETSTLTGYCKIQISENCPNNTEIQFTIDITSDGNSFWSDIFTVLIDSSSTMTEENILQQSALIQNYPNPFSQSTTLRFILPTSSFVTVGVYDFLGREVQTLVNELVSAGEHFINFEANDLLKGIYFCRLKTGDRVLTRKMLLMKRP